MLQVTKSLGLVVVKSLRLDLPPKLTYLRRRTRHDNFRERNTTYTRCTTDVVEQENNGLEAKTGFSEPTSMTVSISLRCVLTYTIYGTLLKGRSFYSTITKDGFIVTDL